MAREQRASKKRTAIELTARVVREQANQMQGLRLTDKRCEELAVDVARHIAAIDAAAATLDLNEEPARFAALLQSTGPRDRRR